MCCVSFLSYSSFFVFILWESLLTYPFLDECPYGGYTTPIRMNECGYFTRAWSCCRLCALNHDSEEVRVVLA